VAEDAKRLGCVKEVRAARDIVKRGTSAHRQVAVYEKALTDGAGEDEALRAVVDWLIAETLAGVALPKG
jgi:carboxylate-amine ligase